MSTWNKEHDPWVLSLDSQSVVLNTSGTYVPVDLEIDVVSGSAGTITAGSASIQGVQVTTGGTYFTSTPTAYAVEVRADATVGTTVVDPQSFEAGWVSSAPTITQGSSDSDTLQTYIKAATTTANIGTDSTYGTEAISTAGWVDSLKINSIAPTTTSNHPFGIAGSASAITYVNLDSTVGNAADFTINTTNVDTLTVNANVITTLGVTFDSGNYLLISGGDLNEVEFKQGQTTLYDDEIIIRGPSDPITVSGGGWNTNTKTVTISLTNATINSSGSTTLSQISGGVVSEGSTYLAFSSETTVSKTAGYVDNSNVTVSDSEINSGIPYYDGAINH